MHRRLLAIPALLLAAAPSLGAPAATDVAGRVLDEVRRARAEAGVAPLERRDDLDRVATERAGEIARLPHAERLAFERSIGDELRAAGARPFRAAWSHLDMVRGYRKPDEGFLKSMRGHTETWNRLLDPAPDGVGIATARAEDGWIVLVVVTADDLPRADDLRMLEREIVAAVNRLREERGLGPLVASEPIAAVARAHSEEMARLGRLDHASADGAGPSDRLLRAGLVYRSVGENVQMSRGLDDPVAAAIDSWMGSDGHREVLLGRDFRQTGVGAATAEDGSVYFTQIFVRPFVE